MLFQVCDPPETIGIGIIQPDETKTYIKKQENARGFSMDKLTKLLTSPPRRPPSRMWYLVGKNTRSGLMTRRFLGGDGHRKRSRKWWN